MADAAAAGGKEAEIEKAMRARVHDFKEQADSLTLEGVRRALEKDMGLELYSLDAHKKFIKQCVDKLFSGSDDENTNNDASEKTPTKVDNSPKDGSKDGQPMSASNKISSSAVEQGARSIEAEKGTEEKNDQTFDSDISEAMIKKAIDERASYFRNKSETLTLSRVRRTLEEDLKLEKNALDAYKSFITKELDKILQEPANGTMKSSKKESCHKDTDQKTRKGSKRYHQDSDTSEINDIHSEREDTEEDTRPKKRGSEGKTVKRQKAAKEDKKLSSPKAKKVAKQDLKKRAEEQSRNSAEDNSHSSAEEDDKGKRQPTPAYGKRVEHLKSIIKSCGMSIAPSVYRRAKQAPESKREACLIKELEDILEKEGLSKNPSEKEIKAVKKRKERAKELEGIDMSNIITSSRRRSTSNFIPLPKPKIETDSDDDDDDNDDDDEGDAEDDNDEENVEGGDGDDSDEAEAGEENVEGGDGGDNDDVKAGEDENVEAGDGGGNDVKTGEDENVEVGNGGDSDDVKAGNPADAENESN